jgi:hypothetical protein
MCFWTKGYFDTMHAEPTTDAQVMQLALPGPLPSNMEWHGGREWDSDYWGEDFYPSSPPRYSWTRYVGWGIEVLVRVHAEKDRGRSRRKYSWRIEVRMRDTHLQARDLAHGKATSLRAVWENVNSSLQAHLVFWTTELLRHAYAAPHTECVYKYEATEKLWYPFCSLFTLWGSFGTDYKKWTPGVYVGIAPRIVLGQRHSWQYAVHYSGFTGGGLPQVAPAFHWWCFAQVPDVRGVEPTLGCPRESREYL